MREIDQRTPPLSPQPRDRSGQATLQRNRARDRIGVAGDMLGDQVIAKEHDALRRLAAWFGIKRNITFAVQPHGAIVEIGGTYPQEDVVDDHRLGMHHDRHICRLPRHRDMDMQALLMVSLAQHGQQPPLVHAHGSLPRSSRTARAAGSTRPPARRIRAAVPPGLRRYARMSHTGSRHRSSSGAAANGRQIERLDLAQFWEILPGSAPCAQWQRFDCKNRAPVASAMGFRDQPVVLQAPHRSQPPSVRGQSRRWRARPFPRRQSGYHDEVGGFRRWNHDDHHHADHACVYQGALPKKSIPPTKGHGIVDHHHLLMLAPRPTGCWLSRA